MNLKELNNLSNNYNNTGKMPVLFVGHGNPMNAIEENEFVQGFRRIGETIPKPNAIVVVSAHWETKGVFITAMKNPRTIHDFSGFPKELYQVQYLAPGDPELAMETKNMISNKDVGLDYDWCLDHGAWTVLRHIYPNPDIPVIELSLDYTKAPKYHYELAEELKPLRYKGVLIIGSGNIVHNLRMIDWRRLNDSEYGYDWATEFSELVKKNILIDNHKLLTHYSSIGKDWNLAVPTAEHYLPLLYSLGMKEKDENIEFFNDKIIGGSLGMTSIKIY